MTDREHLPNSRPHTVVTIEHEWAFDRPPLIIDVGVGRYPDGRVAEVFADGPKGGSQIHGLLDDVCVLISIMLQHGITPAELAKSLGRVRGNKPASAVGAIMDVLVAESGR